MKIAKYDTFVSEVPKYYGTTGETVDLEVYGSFGGQFGTCYIS